MSPHRQQNKNTFLGSKSSGLYPRLTVDTAASRVVSQASAVLLVATADKVGVDRELSAALAPCRKRWAVLDPGKVLLDLAMGVAIGGDRLADSVRGVLHDRTVGSS